MPDTIQDYINITNTKTFKKAHTPFLAKVAEHLDDDGTVGELASTASSVLMKLMWISLGVLRATIQKWSRSCDTHTRLRVREDNEATAKIGLAGYSKRLRHLRRTQKIQLASLSEQLN
jgi:hypothetical protein